VLLPGAKNLVEVEVELFLRNRVDSITSKARYSLSLDRAPELNPIWIQLVSCNTANLNRGNEIIYLYVFVVLEKPGL